MVEIGKRVICDRCGKEIFLKRININVRTPRNPGWGCDVPTKYEELPGDWYTSNIGDTHFCPKCADVYRKFMANVDEVGV